jgi:hypothetical protein
MTISQHDRDILRRLAEQQAQIAALPVHKEKSDSSSEYVGLRHGTDIWLRLTQNALGVCAAA